MEILSHLNYFYVLLFVTTSFFIQASSDNLCEELPFINNGQLLLNEGQKLPFKVNDTLSYQCDENFRTEELYPKVTCVLKENVANWTESNCKPVIISCHDPGYIQNADRKGHMFNFPHKIEYFCHEGFIMRGISSKFCSKSGNWQPSQMPYCEEILCPNLGHPVNGIVTYPDRKLHFEATYECNRHYKLLGDSKRVCQDNATWSGESPVCEKITCKAPKIPNGRIIGRNASVYNANEIIIQQCFVGAIHVTSKCLENGDWSHPPPVCPGTTPAETTSIASTTPFDNKPGEDKIKANFCEDPGKIKNGDRAFVGLHVNSTVTYTCHEGYELRGKSILLCLDSGKWDLDKLPICVKPLSVPEIVGIVFGVIILVLIIVGGYFLYKYRLKHIRGYGEKSKALTADATDIEEIAGLDRDKKHIPVTVL